MARRVLILDTSILCCWLRVPGKATAGPQEDTWNYDRVNSLLQIEVAERASTLVLPIATLIETGNHIANAPDQRFHCATILSGELLKAIDAMSPWATFTEQATLWNAENIRALAESWPQLASRKISLADASIRHVADYYARAGFEVELLTGDRGLQMYYSETVAAKPRRAVRVLS